MPVGSILGWQCVRKLYDNLVPVGPVLERLQLHTNVHHRLHFRPILEWQRVRKFFNAFNIADTNI